MLSVKVAVRVQRGESNSPRYSTTPQKRRFDCVLFWALDRFSREGMAQTIAHLQCLMSYGVAFHSYTEPHLATDNELVRNILLALLSSLAKLEAQKISDRTKAGMARAKANGIRSGGQSSGLKFARRSRSEQRRARRHMPSPRRSGSIDTLWPSMRSYLPEQRQGLRGIEAGSRNY